MAENTKIEWADDTFNPWIGCTMVAPECTNCYAKTMMDDRYGKVKWGPKGTRALTSAANWKKPLQWDKAAAAAGVKRRVFCASLADVFEDNMAVEPCEVRGIFDLDEARAALWSLIEKTPNLIWLLLTKRPESIRAMVPVRWLTAWPANVWTGTSAGCQETADKNIPALLHAPGPHFLSCEPMLGPVDLTKPCDDELGVPSDALEMGIQWVIVGGESGPGARPMHPDWARGLRDQCASAGVAFFFKQWGEWTNRGAVVVGGNLRADCQADRVRLVHPTGQTDLEVFESSKGRSTVPGSMYMRRVGKHTAGRMLDGRTWDELPKAFGGAEVSAHA